MEYFILLIGAMVAVGLLGILPSIQENRRREFKVVFGFDPKMAEKYGRRQLEGMPLVQSQLGNLSSSLTRAHFVLENTPLTELTRTSGDDLVVARKKCQRAMKLARHYKYLVAGKLALSPVMAEP